MIKEIDAETRSALEDASRNSDPVGTHASAVKTDYSPTLTANCSTKHIFSHT